MDLSARFTGPATRSAPPHKMALPSLLVICLIKTHPVATLSEHRAVGKFPLRRSDGHIPIVRVPGAGEFPNGAMLSVTLPVTGWALPTHHRLASLPDNRRL